jgi:ribosome maturation factor RimP
VLQFDHSFRAPAPAGGRSEAGARPLFCCPGRRRDEQHPSRERVTHALEDLRESYALEVSSPGRKRPLTKPDHFRRFLGRRARVRTREEREGHKTFTGELVGAGDDAVTIAADNGVIAIPYADIHRSNLVEE